MKRKEVINTTVDTIEQELCEDVQGPNDDLISDLGMDSMDRVGIAVQLEREFDVAIPDGSVEEWKIVSDVYTTIIGLMGVED